MINNRFLVLMVTLCASLSHAAEPPGVAAFRVFAPNGQVNVLIGTVHVPHAALRQPAASVLDGARTFVIEHTTSDEALDGIDPDAWAGMLEGRSVRAPWARNITKEQISVIVDRFNCSAPTKITVSDFQNLLKLRTARMASHIAFVPCAPPGMRSRDDLLAKAAYDRALPVVALETQQEVGVRRALIPPRFHEASLQYALRLDLEKFYGALAAAVNRGDFDYIEQHAADDVGDADDGAFFKRTMLAERNVAWISRLQAVLDRGQAVVAVGAGHIAGKQGLLALLKERGYRSERITLPAAADSAH